MKAPRTLFALPALLISLTACVPLMAQQIQISKDNKTIAIDTSDEASALADVAAINIGFQSYGKDHTQTYADASVTSNAIISALTGAGVPKDAIESLEQNLRPIGPNSDEDKARWAQGIRFQFNQSWRVTVPASQAAHVLQLAIAAGANNSGNIDWQMKDDNALQAEAARKALEHARQIASSMAEGLHARLGALVYASNQSPPRGIMPMDAMAMSGRTLNAMAMKERKSEPLAISPIRITKSATVYAVFAIE